MSDNAWEAASYSTSAATARNCSERKREGSREPERVNGNEGTLSGHARRARLRQSQEEWGDSRIGVGWPF